MAECIQGYPLALRMAIEVLSYQPLDESIRCYKNRLQKFVRNILDGRNDSVHSCFRTGWETKMERLRLDENGADALRVMQIMGYCYPDATTFQDFKEVFEHSLGILPSDGHADLEHRIDQIMELLKILGLLKKFLDFRGHMQLRVNRVVQSFVRKDDTDGIGLSCILAAKKMNLARHYLRTQPQLVMSPSILRSDQLVISWLICFIEFSICLRSKNAPPVLLFSETHENLLRKRKCGLVEEIRVTVDFARHLLSTEGRENLHEKMLSLVRYGKRIKPGKALVGSLFALSLKLLYRTNYAREQQYMLQVSKACWSSVKTYIAAEQKLLKWLCHYDTVFLAMSYPETIPLYLAISEATFNVRVSNVLFIFLSMSDFFKFKHLNSTLFTLVAPPAGR